MKVLMTCQYYWPDNFLINEIAEDLVKRGHDVTVLTGLPDYATTKVPKEYKWGKRRKEEHNGVKIIRVPIIARRKGFFFRVLNYLSYFISSSIYARTHRIDADVIFAYQLAPVLMLNPGIIYKKKNNIPMFLYVLDLWPDQMKIWHVTESNPAFKMILKYCQKAYGSGDIVGITSKPFKHYLKTVCKVDESKILYLPQHSNKLTIKENIEDLSDEKKQVDFVFAGNIGQQQNIECLLEAVSKMKTKKSFKVHIYGNGTSFEQCKQYAEQLNILNKVIFYGRVSKDELNQIYPKMDAFLLTLCSEKEIGYVAQTVPAKLQGYMSAGKPIFAAINGGAKEIIEESNCGVAVASGDSDSYAQVLDDFVDNPKKYEKCGHNATNYFQKNFEKEIVMDKIEKILMKLINERGKKVENKSIKK